MTSPTPTPRLRLLAGLIFLSGACALVYQVAWLREFRLIFGAATPATAAVLAVFMGGLGVGSASLGRRAERSGNLLRLYAILEAGVALSAFLTPFLLAGVRALYLRTGGVLTLGQTGATLLQLLLALVVLLVPCTLMGGTLPVAVKCVGDDKDEQRGSAGLLYGLNALGALTGVVLSTFWLLELLGTRTTLWTATGLNLLLAAGAGWAARGSNETPAPVPRSRPANQPANQPVETRPAAAAPAEFVYAAAFITGFGFFLSELVWYRMCAPLLGSSTYNFGLILALALAGIGAGGLAYRVWIAPHAGRVSAALFAAITAAQACALVLPYAVGDRMAVVAWDAGQLRSLGFGGQIAGWTLVAGSLVLLPSFFAGVQFPLLVGLLGQGRADVGRQVGAAYAANTAGAIAGSLLGGFLLLPGLTAPGCWRLVVGLALALAAAALFLPGRRPTRGTTVTALGLLAVGLALLLIPLGPTAVWRHTPVGYGRVANLPSSPDSLRNFFREQRRATHQEFEGRESSVGLVAGNSYAFYVNGKSDGAALGDAATQVMSGLIGAALHPQVRTACVVGLGTGSTAGWLSVVPGMERVDVIEIEPGMLHLARTAFAPINQDVLQRPNVRAILGDAREILLVRGQPYDLIFSEPSNPYRAGIASLYTREFYESVRHRLNPGGLFCQWVQGYEVDTATIRRVYATLSAIFPFVETWATQPNDLLFVAHLEAPAYALEGLRRRLAGAPFAEAMSRTWQVDTVEGFLAHHLAGPGLAQAVAAGEREINTDDANPLEYAFARALYRRERFAPSDILRVAIGQKIDVTASLAGQIDAALLREERLLMFAASGESFLVPEELNGDERARAEAIAASVEGNYATVLRKWRGEARSLMARLILAEAAAHAGTPEQARPMLGAIERDWPAEARFAAARLAQRHGAPAAAIEHMKVGLATVRQNPWLRTRPSGDALALATQLGRTNPVAAAAFFSLLEKPLAVAAMNEKRLDTRLALAHALPPRDQVAAVDAYGPHFPWTRAFLEFRLQAFTAAGDPRTAEAQKDLATHLAATGTSFVDSVLSPVKPN